MKKKLIILVLLLVGFSLNAFSYDINKPIWEQVDFITCTQTKHTDCIDHSCKVSEKPILKFTVDFINNEIVFLPNRSMSVIDKLHEFNDNKLLTIGETVNIALKDNKWIFFRTAGIFEYQKSYVSFSSGSCR